MHIPPCERDVQIPTNSCELYIIVRITSKSISCCLSAAELQYYWQRLGIHHMKSLHPHSHRQEGTQMDKDRDITQTVMDGSVHTLITLTLSIKLTWVQFSSAAALLERCRRSIAKAMTSIQTEQWQSRAHFLASALLYSALLSVSLKAKHSHFTAGSHAYSEHKYAAL